MPALQSILPANVVTRVVSRVAASSDWLANLFGVQPGGPNVINEGHGRFGAYTIFNNTRSVAQGRAPATAHATSSPQGVGRVEFTYPRMHDSISLSAEVLHNLGRVDNPAVREGAMTDMISRQERFLGQKAANWRKALLVGTLRDSLYLHRSGDDEAVLWSSVTGARQVHGRMPAGNKAQLNMLGAGNIIDASWAAAATDIPGHLGLINAAFQQLCGGHLAAVICGTKVWNAVMQNDAVAATHGIANAPFTALTRDSLDPEIAKTMKNVYRAVLNVYPDITWYITDEGLDIGLPGAETFSKIIEDNKALFVGFEPGSSDVFGCYEGSEPIAEYDGAAESVKVGLSAWMYKQSNPTRTNLVVLDNALPSNHVPASLAYGTCIF